MILIHLVTSFFTHILFWEIYEEISSSVNNKPAMLAVTKVTKHPENKALKATFTTIGRFWGEIAEIAPIKMPTELMLAKLQMA